MERNIKIDVLKAFAIILVLLGHSIQYGSGYDFYYNASFFDNFAFKLIYSFHMPLFMLISGFLAYQSLNKSNNIPYLITKKIKTILVPILMWSIIPFMISIRNVDSFDFTFLIKRYIYVALDNMWFLWSLLFISIIAIVVNKVFKDNVLIYLLIFILTLIIPDIHNLGLYKFLYPFFVCGYLFHKYNLINKVTNNKLIFSISLILYVILFILFKQNYYVYISGVTILNKNVMSQLFIDIYRIFLGLTGSYVFITIIISFMNYMTDGIKKFLLTVGQNTLGIYAISDIFFKSFLGRITYNFNMNYLTTILEMIIILFICLVLIELLKKSKFLNKVLFGGR